MDWVQIYTIIILILVYIYTCIQVCTQNKLLKGSGSYLYAFSIGTIDFGINLLILTPVIGRIFHWW